MKELLILRHGKAEKEPVNDDFNRELADKGKRHTQRMAVWLQQQQLIPDTIISSPASRALTTAQKCCKAMQMDARMIITDQRIYDDGVSGLIDILQEQNSKAKRLMLVGHNPTLDDLVEYLVKPTFTINSSHRLSTASLAQLKLPANWNKNPQGSSKLIQVTHASSLPKGFPFPDPDSKEMRKRPAYYYTQSSVIPYRIQDNRLEILVTRSSQKKHWVVPKGIADPGHSLQESAAKEAWEEAGVEGEVSNDAVGTYQYHKWGATCTVTVYSMRVSRQLSDDEWEEQHRGRKWLAANDAANEVRQPEPGNLIRQFAKQIS
jgi:phosphohistidine phosphatase